MARKRFEDKIEDVNLMPIMGLMVVLIPMVLLMTSFVHIGIINVSAPRAAVGAPQQQEDDNKPLNLTVGISREKGFSLMATGGLLPGQDPLNPDTIKPLEIAINTTGKCGPETAAPGDKCELGKICPGQCGDGNICTESRECLKWDYMALYNLAVEIKKQYPNETVANVTADSNVSYGTLIAVMDALRLQRVKESYDDNHEFINDFFKTGVDGSPELLFNDVVFAVVQQ